MAGRVEGKVAFITGAARGQGRSARGPAGAGGRRHHRGRHLRPDRPRCRTRWRPPEDLAETVKAGRGAGPADRRHPGRRAGLRRAARPPWTTGVAQLGRLDIVLGQRRDLQLQHAGRASTDAAWQDMIDVNLTGVWHTGQGGDAAPDRAAGGGSIILTSSTAGLKAMPNTGALRRGQARRGRADADAGPRAGPAHRSGSTPCTPPRWTPAMIQNEATYGLFAPDLPRPSRTEEGLAPVFQATERACRSRGSSRSTSPTRCCCWPPTRRVTSPA